jgi:aspartyl-tRNA(Asn)/glutamyl-tRNA(Gln) amidotransferase subunit C
MSLGPEDVKRIAYLARLEISEDAIPEYVRNLGDILQMVEQMNAVDTKDVAPMAHPQDAAQRLRSDVVTESDQRERFQAIAPLTEAGLYLVPKVIE